MKDQIKEMIQKINPFIDILDDTDLIEDGVLDSLGIMSLIMDIEDRFGIKIDIEKIELKDFQTLETVTILVEGLL